MLPIGTNTSAYIIQPPLVNTTTPGTSVVHVPYDNVAPSVSGSQVDNNAKGNSTVPTPAEEQAAATSDNVNNSPPSSAAQGSVTDPMATGAQAPFIAQLVGQDDTQTTSVILSQYEKLIEFSNVKYKPSNAFKPAVEPSSVFGRLIANEKASGNNTYKAPQQTSAPPTAGANKEVSNAEKIQNTKNAAPENAIKAAQPEPTHEQAISAYTAGASHQDSKNTTTTKS